MYRKISLNRILNYEECYKLFRNNRIHFIGINGQYKDGIILDSHVDGVNIIYTEISSENQHTEKHENRVFTVGKLYLTKE